MNYEPHSKIDIRDIYANRHEPEQIRKLADIYWYTLLSFAVLVVLLATIYGMLELTSLLRSAGASLESVFSSQPHPALNRSQLQNTLDEFQARRQLFESFKTHTSKVTDPV